MKKKRKNKIPYYWEKKKSRTERRRLLRRRAVAINKLREVGVRKILDWEVGSTPNTSLFNAFKEHFGERIDDYIKRIDQENVDGGAEVYIIGSLHFGFVKIGYSKDVRKRLKQIQTGCPFELDIIARFPGTVAIEKSLHDKYDEYRLRGEWFKYEGKLKEAIENQIK